MCILNPAPFSVREEKGKDFGSFIISECLETNATSFTLSDSEDLHVTFFQKQHLEIVKIVFYDLFALPRKCLVS